MSPEEFHAWMEKMRREAGHWRVDPCHDGISRSDLMVYCARPDDPTAGLYAAVEPDPQMPGAFRVSAGRFEGAVPHIGEALFMPRRQSGGHPTFRDALLYGAYRIGLPFLLETPAARKHAHAA